ncbi:MAG: hypothetical protein LBG13_01110 [Holosporales bacterium]|jgi:hypothetical protein|nr:hypothetical protein [Holosporales bacterium]
MKMKKHATILLTPVPAGSFGFEIPGVNQEGVGVFFSESSGGLKKPIPSG